MTSSGKNIKFLGSADGGAKGFSRLGRNENRSSEIGVARFDRPATYFDGLDGLRQQDVEVGIIRCVSDEISFTA
jgi:hypothetical protein